ncbi:MAG: RNA polymerase factor sigma-54 [Hyphomicrobiaceae bacterium]
MAITAKLELRHSQQLVMTPQLQQAIKLLQLSNLELNAFVETELERNPLLEREEEGERTATASDGDSDRDGGEADTDGFDEAAPDRLELDGDMAGATKDLDADYETVFPDTPRNELGGDFTTSDWASARQRNGGSDEDANLEEFVAKETSLKELLSSQLHMALNTPVDLLIGGHLIDMVDEAGYLRADLDEVAEKLGTTMQEIERVLAVLQTFEPSGVMARSLSECLAIQLKERGRYDPMIARLLDALPLLAARNIPALRREIGADMEDLADMIAEIKALNPKPGLNYGGAAIQPVVPDVLVRAASDGSWLVELNSETLPRVLVNRVYYTRVTSDARTSQDKDFLVGCLQSASWLVKSLDQRARTILRVAEEIVRQQDRFLAHGVQYLRPLNLKTVADAIKMHESTVSRVTSNKYMATPRGIFEMKYFFTSAIASASDGEAHSSEAVRHRIRTLIDAETANTVLSDDKLVELLGQEGIEIARRTVAKYRESMRIPSSVQRRREKRLNIQTPALA